MNSFTLVCLSIGSNQGNRIGNLNHAIQLLHERVGNVEEVSRIYETPAWGFKGEDFLNACVVIKTSLSAQILLHEIQLIEKDLGRIRTSEAMYQNRIIDIDIIFFGSETHDSKRLTVPHPKITERNFVLIPLLDVSEILNSIIVTENIKKWIQNTSDKSTYSLIKDELIKPSLPKIKSTYVAIEGNIGAGKTSLATMIAEDYNAKLITERFKDNPFLPKFYKDQNRYAFPLEMSFLADRYQQLLDDISQYDLFSDFVVADYDVYKSLIFAKVTLQDEEFSLYKKVFEIMYKELPKPDLYIYLYQNTERLLENIKKRGRSYEQNINPDYLQNINSGYLNFIKNQHQNHFKIIDISEIDFVENRSDYITLLNTLAKSDE